MIDICKNDLLVVANDGKECVIIALAPKDNGRYGLDCIIVMREPKTGVDITGGRTMVVVTRHAAERFFTRVRREQVPAKRNELPDEISNVAFLCVAEPEIVNEHLSPGFQATWRIQTKTGTAVAVMAQRNPEFLVTTWMPAGYSGATGTFDIRTLLGLGADPVAFTNALLAHAIVEPVSPSEHD